MSRRKKDPLRPLTDLERAELTRLSRSQAAPAVQVARATMLLAVADGDDYQAAARVAGRRARAPGARPPGRPPAPRPAAPATPSRTWSPASTLRAWPPPRPAMAAAIRSS